MYPAVVYVQIEVICKYYGILFKALEHPHIWVSKGGLGTNSLQILRDSYRYKYIYRYNFKNLLLKNKPINIKRHFLSEVDNSIYPTKVTEIR